MGRTPMRSGPFCVSAASCKNQPWFHLCGLVYSLRQERANHHTCLANAKRPQHRRGLLSTP